MNSRSRIDEQANFHERIGAHNLAALWVGRRGVDLTKPNSPAQAVRWHYDGLREDLAEAGDIVTAEEAFRRVLVLENPAYKGEMRVTNSLYAGLQLVLPGEVAPCHRHSQTAIRFVIEGTGAYTSVDGERIWLHPGDFVITPNWAWHDHSNEGDVPVVWLDVLDTPLVDFLDTTFRENYAAPQQQISQPDGHSGARYGAGLLPIHYHSNRLNSPVFSYPYAQTKTALETLRKVDQWDNCHGLKMRYSNPTTGDHATPTMAAFLQVLPGGFDGGLYQTTESTVYCVVEGQGRSVINDQTIEWGPRDLFVIPGWHPYRHAADEDAVLFSVSDQPMQTKFGLWREEQLGDPAA
ncbi:gentisate 1,2-dioxygenase [Alphaproteobacteria bacterium]|nr:gentisate 1,2-dioxygenase [Alphaproteobacteria bacterium]